MKDERYRKLHHEFDRIVNILMEVDSGEFPIVFIMGAGDDEEDFILGGNVEPDSRIDYIRSFLEAVKRNGVAGNEMVKKHSGVN